MNDAKKQFLTFFDDACKRENLSQAGALERMRQHYPVPGGTFSDTISWSKPNLNANVVIAFCKTFGYDIYQIYVDQAEGAAPPPMKTDSAVDPALPDSFYGTFYGYFFSSTPEYLRQGLLDQFTLDVGRSGISMLLRRYALNVEAGNQYAPSEIALTGTVIHNPGGQAPSGILALSFTAEKDRCFCTLAYNKCQLNSRLFFRRGALLIQSRGEEVLPVIQSFLFTRQKIDLDYEENRRALQGALTLVDPASRTILLKKKDLAPFMDTELLKKYFKNQETLDGACEEYVALEEDRLLRMDVDSIELYETLFQIKAKAANARLYSFPITDRSWHYIGTLCRQEQTCEQEQ